MNTRTLPECMQAHDPVARGSSSVRSAMFIETNAPITTQVSWSGMRINGDQPATGCDRTAQQPRCRSYGAWTCVRLQQTINMALLTEVFHVCRPALSLWLLIYLGICAPAAELTFERQLITFPTNTASSVRQEISS